MSRATKQESYQEMWNILGVDHAPKKPQLNIKQWQKVVDSDGKIVTADKVMAKHGFAVDATIPAPGGYTTGMVNLNQINGLALDNVFLGWGELSLLQQNCIVNNICTILANSMTEKWVEFHSTDKDKADKIEELEKSIKKFDVKELMNTAAYKAVLLGTSYVSPKLKGDDEDLKDELILDSSKIGKGDLEAIYVIEPTWIVPIEFNMVNPRADNFYKPQAYIVFGERLHESRMKRLMYIEPVNLISPMYLFGGQPVIQNILPYILDFINTKKQIVQIVSRLNTSVLQTDLTALKGFDAYGKTTTLAGNVKGRAAAFNALRNNFGLFLMDKNETFTQMQINTAGLEGILQQQGELLSLFTRIPVTYLFGQSPKGLNATGQLDAQVYNEMILAMQESKLRPILDYIFGIMQLNLWGEIDESISYNFVPLGSVDELTQSQLKDAKVNRLVNLANGGMADPVALMDVAVADPELELSDYKVSEGFGNEDETE